MEQKALQRLETLRRLNSNSDWINQDLYRLMYKEDLYRIAYENIKAKLGNMTAGVDGQKSAPFPLTVIQEVIGEMKAEQYRFQSVKRRSMPTSSGKVHGLDMPSVPVQDKLVQEVLRLILEAIYESPLSPYFLDDSHGFRPNRGCHTALQAFRQHWSATNWISKGDVRGCLEEWDHALLIHILRKKMADERFLNLIRKWLKAGYLEELTLRKRDSLADVPQGGIVSPILANILLHELDQKVLEMKQRLNSGERKRVNPAYEALYHQFRHLVRAAGNKMTAEAKEVGKRMREIPSVDASDPYFIRIHYLRYADEWIIGVSGPLSIARNVHKEVSAFLRESLKLSFADEKEEIIHARTRWTEFLGTLLKMGREDGHASVMTQEQAHDGKVEQRSVGWQPVLYAPVEKLLKRLASKGFCDKQGKPREKTGWIPLAPEQILRRYSAMLRGILNYYRFVDNFSALRKIQFVLQYSCAKTFAAKYKISVRQVFKKYGKHFTVLVKEKGKTQKVTLYVNKDWQHKPNHFNSKDADIDHVRI
jgi:group II intron reverse transcriptase/maturase